MGLTGNNKTMLYKPYHIILQLHVTQFGDQVRYKIVLKMPPAPLLSNFTTDALV